MPPAEPKVLADLLEISQTLASALDIRQVFPQVSAIANQMLPHDRLTMTLHDGQQTCIAHAASNDDGPFLVRASGAQVASMVEGTSRIIDDLTLAANKARQSRITKEMLEIASGAEALGKG